jgi:HK97 family phage portal protein
VTVLGRLLRSSLENAELPLTSTALADWLGGARSKAGVAVSEPRVYGLPAYYRGVAIKAGTLGCLPIKVYRKGTRERVRTETVLDSPNPRDTPLEFWMTMYANGIAWGNAFGRKLRDGSDQVIEVWPIHPSRVRVEAVAPTPDNPEGKRFLVRDQVTGQVKEYTSWDIFHLPYMTVGGVEGMRPLSMFRQSLGIAIAGDDSAASFYGNGSRISGILTTDQKLEENSATRLKKAWKEKVSGPDNAGEIAVLDKGAKFQPVMIPPADAQLLQSRQWAVSEIGRMIGILPHLVGDVDKTSSWGTGVEQQTLGWVKYDLQSWISAAEQRITRELLPGGWSSGIWYAEIAVEGLLRGDSAARAAFYHAAITDGWMNRNEVRPLENLEPAEGLDEFIVPSNMTLISIDGEIVPLGQGATE